MIFYVVVYFFKDGLYRTHLVWVLFGSLAIVSVYGIFQFADLIGMWRKEGGLTLVESVMPGEVWLTTYLVMLIPLGLALAFFVERRAARICYIWITGLATICLLMTFSRAGALAVLGELGALAWFLRSKIVMAVAAVYMSVVVLCGAFLSQYSGAVQDGLQTIPGTSIPITKVTTSSMAHRMDIDKFVVTKIVEHPVFGIGYGKDNFKLVFGQSTVEIKPGHSKFLEAGTHNTFLDIALGVGIPGLVLFVWLLKCIAVLALVEFRQAGGPMAKAILLSVGVSTIGLSVRLFFDHMLIGTLAILFWILVAMAMLAHSSADRTQAQRV